MLAGATPLGRGDTDYIDTSAYRFEAVVDWLSFRVKTVDPTQWPYIQKHLAGLIGSKPHVMAINPDTGKKKSAKGAEGITSTVFDFQVYDDFANNGEKLRDLFSHLASKFPLAGTPQVTGIEIAFDAYSRGNLDGELREMTLWMMSHINVAGANVRQFDDRANGSKGANLMIAKESNRRPLDPELNLRIGNQRDALSYQVYWKRTDKVEEDEDGTRRAKSLPHDQCRARSEFTLLSDKLASEGIHTLNDLAGFDMGRLANYLRFANQMTLEQAIEGKDRFTAGGIKMVWDDRAVCLNSIGWNRRDTGPDGHRKHATPKPLKYSRYATPNKSFNRIVTDSFANLGARYLRKKYNENDQSTIPTTPEPA
jgi:hypothetical protein